MEPSLRGLLSGLLAMLERTELVVLVILAIGLALLSTRRRKGEADGELARMEHEAAYGDPVEPLLAPLEPSATGAGTVGDCVPEALRRNQKRVADIRQFAQRGSVN